MFENMSSGTERHHLFWLSHAHPNKPSRNFNVFILKPGFASVPFYDYTVLTIIGQYHKRSETFNDDSTSIKTHGHTRKKVTKSMLKSTIFCIV